MPRNVGLGISVCDAHINDHVGIALLQMADHEIVIKGVVLLFVFACDSGDLGFVQHYHIMKLVSAKSQVNGSEWDHIDPM
eukprot:4417669-Ditylum_brightwellii.AAC.1